MRIKASSLAEYLAEVSKLRKTWKVPETKELWFRPEDACHHETRLLPGLYRPTEKKRPSKSVQPLLKLESYLHDEFRRCATQLSPIDATTIDDGWDSYFLMQHHGVPTRLLDWTDGALIALHFAVRDKPAVATTGSTIFVLNPYWLIALLESHPDRLDSQERWEKFLDKEHPIDMDKTDWDRLYLPEDDEDAGEPLLRTPATPVLWDSPHSTRRIAAQRSRFMVFGTDPNWLQKMEGEPGSRLVEITIPKGAVTRIKRELRDAGITESVVFPDLDGLGRELKQQWKMRR